MPPDLAAGYNDRQALAAIKTSLQANLTDPREQYTATDRNWIHTDRPLASATYPRIQVRKRGPTVTEKISMGRGSCYIEWRSMIVDIQFWSKAPFKWKTADNVYLQDEELVREWLDKIWVALKAQEQTLYNSDGITGFKPVDEGDAFLEPDTQLYSGVISIRVWYFRK